MAVLQRNAFLDPYEVSESFSTGLYPFWLQGIDRRELCFADRHKSIRYVRLSVSCVYKRPYPISIDCLTGPVSTNYEIMCAC